jgi:hypothetical protein
MGGGEMGARLTRSTVETTKLKAKIDVTGQLETAISSTS